MCGIIGYAGENPALSFLVRGLENLVYRGYDSAGIALQSDGIDVFKQKGDVSELDLPDAHPATCGIGHTRWSTHGEPTDANAHPHTDCTGDIAVVHNGIIENYDELEETLDGHRLTSDTDTEVVAHLLEDVRSPERPLREDVATVVEMLRGSFALAFVSADADEIVVVRNDSPLVVGYGDGCNFVASDVPAFIESTDQVSYLENGDIATITARDVCVYRDGEPVELERDTVKWEPEAAQKAGYDHFTLKEIHEQPRALRQAISGRIDEVSSTANLDVTFPRTYLQSLEEVQFVGAGTSNYAGEYAAQLFEKYAGVRASANVASEYTFTGNRDPWRTLVIAVTQSGETADTIAALRRANRAGARTLTVTNTVGSTGAREADDELYIRAGPEKGVAASKTFISQVATLTLLGVYLGRERKSLSTDRASSILENVRGLPGAVQQVLDRHDEIREVAATYDTSDAYFFIGRRLGTSVAREGALKMKEISYEHAYGYPAGELKHGPLAQVTTETPVIAILAEGAAPEATVNSAKEAKSRGAPIVGCVSGATTDQLLDVRFDLPSLGVMEPLVATVYMQLLAYYTAKRKGREIDKPRNLAKSVTVE